MKKIIIAAVIVMAGAFGIFKANNNNNLSELQMENVEALAQQYEVSVPFLCYTDWCTCYRYPDGFKVEGIKRP